jgi:hypothetical protein
MPAAEIRRRSAGIGGRLRRAVAGSFFNHLRFTAVSDGSSPDHASPSRAPSPGPADGRTGIRPLPQMPHIFMPGGRHRGPVPVDPSDPAGTRAFVICCGNLCAPGVRPRWVCSIESSAYPRGSPCRWDCARAATRRTSTGFHNNQQRPTCPPAHLGPQYRRRGYERRRLRIRRVKQGFRTPSISKSFVRGLTSVLAPLGKYRRAAAHSPARLSSARPDRDVAFPVGRVLDVQGRAQVGILRLRDSITPA